MKNKELRNLLEQYPDDLPIMLEISGSDFPEVHDTLNFEVIHINQGYRKDCQYIGLKGYVD